MSTLMLIDGHALAYRAFHAFPPLTTPKGELVNAVYGFTRILLTVVRDLTPEYLCVCFDMHAPTFRHTQYTGYKAQREEMPTELASQIERIKEMVVTLNIPLFGIEGYEADDTIGTIATRAATGELDHVTKILIVTGDRDAFQLVTDKIHVYMPPRGKDAFSQEFGPEEVREKMGIGPEQIIEYKALAGDASDNIPGVKGVGDKTAVRLLQTFGTAEKIYEALKDPSSLSDEQKVILKPKVVENLSNGYESMVMSRSLATIDTNAPITFTLQDCVLKNYDKSKAMNLIDELGFKSLIKLLPSDSFESGVQDALF
jgi:DNA polymerase I